MRRLFPDCVSFPRRTLVSILILVAAGPLPTLCAAITTTGIVDPADPIAWTSSTDGYIGSSADGSLVVDLGSDLYSRYGYIGFSPGVTGHVTIDGSGSTWTNRTVESHLYIGSSGNGTLDIIGGAAVSNTVGEIGYNAGSTGEVTVDGDGSTWTNNGDLYVGHAGSGTLNISGGAAVSVAGTTFVAYETGSTGSIEFGSGGGTLTTKSLRVSSSQVLGSGTINTRGLLTDVDLRFDATHGLNQMLSLNPGSGQSITVVLDMASAPSSNGELGAGYQGNGVLTIQDGIAVNSTFGWLGYRSGSTGTAKVAGNGSKWNNSSDLFIGNSGSGTLNIADGGAVSNTAGYVGNNAGSTGNVTIDGTGSIWTNNGDLYVGISGSGTLNIADGGAVSSWVAHIGQLSGAMGVVTVDGEGSKWVNGAGLYVGDSGDGTLNITGGGSVRNTYCNIGSSRGATGKVTIDGTGSTWTNSLLSVGDSGNATLSITGGGTVSSATGAIGFGSRSVGTVSVDGPGSMWAAGSLDVGHTGDGTLTVVRGGTVSTITAYIGSSGRVVIDGADSTWTNSFDLHINNPLNGTLQINGGATVTVAGTTYVSNDAGSSGTISFGSGSGTLTTGSIVAAPGQFSGTGTINSAGLVSDVNLMFDATDSLVQTFTFNSQPGQNVTLSLDMASDPSSNGDLGAGYRSYGVLTIQNGIAVVSKNGYVAYEAGSMGAVTVKGTASSWINQYQLYVGNSGSGTLRILSGGAVSNGYGYIGFGSSSTGEVTVKGTGSKWINGGELAVGYEGSGTLTIADGGAVSNSDGCIGRYATGLVTIDGTDSKWNNSGRLYVSSGSLKISNGGTVTCSYGQIGSDSYASCQVTVDGAGSQWINSDNLYIGKLGTSTLAITSGGIVRCKDAYIGGSTPSTMVTVDNTGSQWINSGRLEISTNGALTIASGGIVTATNVSIRGQSLLAIDVGSGSQLTVGGGTGAFSNSGTVRITAGVGAMANAAYSPISAGTWSGIGVYQPIGGTWDGASHVFTVSGVELGTSGTPVVIDLLSKQRVLIDDTDTGWTIGASFSPTANSTPLTFTATPVGEETLTQLLDLLPAGESVMGAWEFAADGGYTSGSPVYLSFDSGSDQDGQDLLVWHYDGTDWSPYAANDLTCDGTYASFAVTSFSGYAVTAAPTPEPTPLALLAMGLLSACIYLGQRRWAAAARR